MIPCFWIWGKLSNKMPSLWCWKPGGRFLVFFMTRAVCCIRIGFRNNPPTVSWVAFYPALINLLFSWNSAVENQQRRTFWGTRLAKCSAWLLSSTILTRYRLAWKHWYGQTNQTKHGHFGNSLVNEVGIESCQSGIRFENAINRLTVT